MYRPITKIGIGYLLFTILYYAVFAIIFYVNKESANNFLEALLIALGDIFYWVNVHAYFFLTMLISSIAGMLISWRRKEMKIFKIFMYIGIGTVVVAGVLIIIANIN